MSKFIIVLIIVVVVFLLLWVFLVNRERIFTPGLEEVTEEVVKEEEEISEPRQAVVNLILHEQSDSGISGTATLIDSEEGLWVILQLEGAPEGIAQPAHIHRNTCEEIEGVLYNLNFPLNGFSQTLLPLTPEELMANLPLSINIHKLAQEPQVYVACGNI